LRSLRRWTGVLAVAGTAVLSAGCSETTGTGEPGFAQLAVQPVLPTAVTPGLFDLAVDRVRVRVIRPPAALVLDTLVFFPADQSQLAIRLRVPLNTSREQLSVSLELISGARLLFAGTDLVEFSGQPATATIPMQFVGPGTAMTLLRIVPRDTAISPGTTYTFGVLAFTGTEPIDSFYVGWSTSDPDLAKVDARGVLQAPAQHGSVILRATSPTGVRDSTLIYFAPPPTRIVLVGGDNQTGQAGLALPNLLMVQALTADQQGAPGVRVRFQSLSGGRVLDTLVTTGADGKAWTAATLGPVAGVQGFEARAPGLVPIGFTATATAGPPSALLILAGAGQIDTVGHLLPTSFIARVTDATGNGLANVPVTWEVLLGGGTLTGASLVSNLSGIVYADYALGHFPGRNVVRVSLPNGASADFEATALAGAPYAVKVLSGDQQADTAGATLSPFVGYVTDQLGNILPGITAHWSEVQGGGHLDRTTSVGDAAGRVTATYRLPTVTGSATVLAELTGGVVPALFRSTVLPASPAALERIAGNAQSDSVTATLAPFQVRVRDQFGNLVPGATVAWHVIQGDGTLSAVTSMTNGLGVAEVVYTLGTTPGQHQVSARLPSGAAVTFTATATP
jgi:hypothetical protein